MKPQKYRADGQPKIGNKGRDVKHGHAIVYLGGISVPKDIAQDKVLAKQIRFIGREAGKQEAKRLLKLEK